MLSFREYDVFTLDSRNFCISTLFLKLEKTMFVIHHNHCLGEVIPEPTEHSKCLVKCPY